jgi:hypothetical protein
VDEDDYRALIAVVESELREIGAGEIADERHYVVLDQETGDARLLAPPRRLLEMLRAFGRMMSVEDHATYERAMFVVAEHLRGDRPRGAVVVPTADDRDAVPIDLAVAPNLGEARFTLGRLIERLSAEGGTMRDRY